MNPVVPAIVLILIAAGCALPLEGRRIDETRHLSLRGSLTATASTTTSSGTALVTLYEARHYRTKQISAEDFLWSVRASGIDRSTVSAVHVHERDTDRVLFLLPLENANAPLEVITQAFTRRPHNGAIAQWSDVYEFLGMERGYLDVHVGGSGNPLMRANLTAQNPNWRDFSRANCS